MDGALSGTEEAGLARHLADCSGCRSASERLQRTWHLLEAADETASAPDDWLAIERSVEVRRSRWTPTWLVWRFPPVPAAAALGFAGMMALGVAGGALLSRETVPADPAQSMEAQMFAETLGDLPWGSPAAGLGGVLDGRLGQENQP